MARRHPLPFALLPLLVSCFATFPGGGRGGGGCTGCRSGDIPGCSIDVGGGGKKESEADAGVVAGPPPPTRGAPDAASSAGTGFALGVVELTRGLSIGEIGDVVGRNQKPLRACSERHLRAHPTLGGVVVVSLTIDPWGSVVAASAHGVHAELEACLVSLFQRVVFPRPATGARVDVSLPFTVTQAP